VGILRTFGVPVVVTVNRLPDDDPGELAVVAAAALEAGASSVAEHWGYARGGEGCVELAEAVAAACGEEAHLHQLYQPDDTAEVKVASLATQVYGAGDVAWDPPARRALDRLRDAGYGHLPICVAKTHLSLSHDPKLKGRPTGFTLPVRDVRLSAGAGFVYPLCGTMLTMPGLPHDPVGAHMDIDEHGQAYGLH
jgi:formyltetrahydrofolate synthetase